MNSRPFAAAGNYRKGLAHKILVASVPLNKVDTLGIAPTHTALNRAVLIKLGVQETRHRNLWK